MPAALLVKDGALATFMQENSDEWIGEELERLRYNGSPLPRRPRPGGTPRQTTAPVSDQCLQKAFGRSIMYGDAPAAPGAPELSTSDIMDKLKTLNVSEVMDAFRTGAGLPDAADAPTAEAAVSLPPSPPFDDSPWRREPETIHQPSPIASPSPRVDWPAQSAAAPLPYPQAYPRAYPQAYPPYAASYQVHYPMLYPAAPNPYHGYFAPVTPRASPSEGTAYDANWPKL